MSVGNIEDLELEDTTESRTRLVAQASGAAVSVVIPIGAALLQVIAFRPELEGRSLRIVAGVGIVIVVVTVLGLLGWRGLLNRLNHRADSPEHRRQVRSTAVNAWAAARVRATSTGSSDAV